MIDLNLKQWATEKQWAYLEAVEKHGSGRKAAAALGVDKSAINRSLAALRAKAAQHGYSPDHDLVHPSAPGFKVKGTSTLYDYGGNVRAQWVKTTVDQEQQEAAFKSAIEAMTADVPRIAPVKPPKVKTDELLTCYPIGDHHVGMMAWHKESGADYDLVIAETSLMRAMDHLVSLSPDCEQGLMAVLGDFLHIDSFKVVTPTHGYLLDADSRFPKMVAVAIRVLRYGIDCMLRKHAKAHVIIELGNHDPSSAIFMMQLLANVYEKEPRITIDTSPKPFHYFQFGKNMIATNHGDKVKLVDLPLIMATDQPKMWGETEHRFCWTGHVHHYQGMETRGKELKGVTVESFPVLAPEDAHASSNGYRSKRSMKSIILHREFGEDERHTFNPARFL